MAASPAPGTARLILFGLILLLLALFVLHLGLGSTSMVSPGRVVGELLRGRVGDTGENIIVWEVRLTRGLACLLGGGLLAGVGSAFQALFRNPLAEPYVVGVSSGAAVGGVAVSLIGLTGILAGLGQVAGAFVGGLLSLLLVLGLAGRRGAVSVTALLLSGVVVGSMLSALLTLLIVSSGRDSNQLLRWLMGDASHVGWSGVGVLATVLAIGGPLLVIQSKALNAFAIGEETARRLGVDTRALRRRVLGLGTAMTAAAVGVLGIIAFLGLVAPHLARSLLGVDWRRSLLGSILVGSALLLAADALAQRASSLGVVEIPVGAVTALIGAPSLLILLRGNRA